MEGVNGLGTARTSTDEESLGWLRRGRLGFLTVLGIRVPGGDFPLGLARARYGSVMRILFDQGTPVAIRGSQDQ